jgi:hypothetical protein
MIDRMRWTLALVLAGCYSPHEVPGSPCSPAQPACPGDQICVTGAGGSFCEAPGSPTSDAAIDGRTDAPADAAIDGPADDDSDGVPNASDNCPTVANADQGNEDGDAFGDACDPCPPSATNTDSDGDGVGDDCDPNPTTIGDHIALFEGFHDGKPAGWTYTGPWTATNDSLDVNAADATFYNVALPAISKHETVIIGYRIVSTVGTGYRGAGVFDNATNAGAGYATACSLLITSTADASPNTPLVDLFDIPSAAALDRTGFAWGIGHDLVTGLARHDNSYYCYGYDTVTMTNASVSGTDSTDNGIGEIGLHMGAANVHFHWLMVVTQP